MEKRKKRFNQKQKLSVIEKGAEIGISEAAEVAGVHYSTVYDWKNLSLKSGNKIQAMVQVKCEANYAARALPFP